MLCHAQISFRLGVSGCVAVVTAVSVTAHLSPTKSVGRSRPLTWTSGNELLHSKRPTRPWLLPEHPYGIRSWAG